MEYKIRWAAVEDAEELGYVHAKSWQVAYKNIMPDKVLAEITPEKRASRFKEVIENKTEENAVVVVDGEVVGFITIGESRDNDCGSATGEIWGLYLLPAYWDRGLGSALLSWGIKELSKRGYEKVTLWVLKDNDRARDFYERKGFKPEGKKEEIEIGSEQLEKVRYEKKV